MKTEQKSPRGFSLIELLLVVAVIAIVAAIAIPNYIQAKNASRSASAIASLRLIHSCEVSHRNVNGDYADLSTLNNSGCLNDASLGAGQKSDYQFVLTTTATPSYSATATPIASPTTRLHFFIDESGVIRSASGTPATSSSPPI